MANRPSLVIPACVTGPFPSGRSTKTRKKNLRLLFTGSLWLPHNHEGIVWFVQKVWPHVEPLCELVIAGATPSSALLKLIEMKKGIRLVADPKHIEHFFKHTDLLVVPMFSRSGMKVKIAQAFSYGIAAVGTDAAFLGYEIVNERNSFVANNEREFVDSIRKYAGWNSGKRKTMEREVRKLFLKNHSIASCQKELRKVFSENKGLTW